MNPLVRVMKQLAYRVAPRTARGIDEWYWLRKQAKFLRSRAPACDSPKAVYELLAQTNLCALQKPKEIVGLVDLLAKLKPQRLCEVGSYDGGTLFLFAQVAAPSAHLVSLDIHFGRSRRSAFPLLIKEGQRLTCLEADSHSEQTRRDLERILEGGLLDFLFIDGDHSFEGVSRDFELYSSLVRPGGVIAFHDIVPDYRTRFGQVTASNGGDVWRLWKDIRGRYSECYEFFQEGPEQDGYGIGAIVWPGRDVDGAGAKRVGGELLD